MVVVFGLERKRGKGVFSFHPIMVLACALVFLVVVFVLVFFKKATSNSWSNGSGGGSGVCV